MKHTLLAALSLTMITGLAGCGVPIETLNGNLSADSYDQSCVLNSDCLEITTGHVCTPCSCPGAAINKRERSAYERDAERALTTCDENALTDSCQPCKSTRAICNDANACESVSVVAISAASFDQSCEQDADCLKITTGDVCNVECMCPDAAINVADSQEYMDAVAAASCGASESTCSVGCQDMAPSCVDSVCTLANN